MWTCNLIHLENSLLLELLFFVISYDTIFVLCFIFILFGGRQGIVNFALMMSEMEEVV